MNWSEFYEAVWHARNPTHMIVVKLLIFTGLRNAELARVRLQDMDLDHCQVHVVQGKGSKDRSVLFPSSFRRELGSISMDRGSAAPCSYSNRTGCGRTPLVASGRSSINRPQPLGSRNGSTRSWNCMTIMLAPAPSVQHWVRKPIRWSASRPNRSTFSRLWCNTWKPTEWSPRATAFYRTSSAARSAKSATG